MVLWWVSLMTAGTGAKTAGSAGMAAMRASYKGWSMSMTRRTCQTWMEMDERTEKSLQEFREGMWMTNEAQ